MGQILSGHSVFVRTSAWRWPRSVLSASAGRRSASRCTRCSEAFAAVAAAVAAVAPCTSSAGGCGSRTAVQGHEAF